MPHIKSSKPQRQDTIATSKKPFSIPHKKVHVLHPVFAVKCIISHCYCSNIIRDKNKIKKPFFNENKKNKSAYKRSIEFEEIASKNAHYIGKMQFEEYERVKNE